MATETVQGQRCRACNKFKTLDQFHKQASGRYGYRGTCKNCRKQGERWGFLELKAHHLKERYGISLEEYQALGTQCHACGAASDLQVDHCHRTGKVRGLLCGSCNRTLGHAKDDPERLLSLIEYLREGESNSDR